MGKVGLITLGCPKNQVDTEDLAAFLRDRGIEISDRADDSDVILVNTCGFIENAKKESIEEILRCAEIKEAGTGKKLVVFGCLSQRYGEALRKEIPEIDALCGIGEHEKILDYIKTAVPSDEKVESGHADPCRAPRMPGTGSSYAYVKIADGCDRACSFCIIPSIRGRYTSRQPDAILRESEKLVLSGSKELILVAQDITSYGNDLDGYDLGMLLEDMASISGDFWIRLLYLHPMSIDDRLITTIGSTEKICKYIDMPLQHSSSKILKLMKRGGNRSYYESLISRLRAAVPGVSIRTTFLVGFPGETDHDFQDMKDFVRKVKFDRLGVFEYSREEGTPAFRLTGQVPRNIKQQRYGEIMELQAEISFEKNEALTGKTYRALVDDVDNGIAVARLYSHAPEIDGAVIIRLRGDENVRSGTFVDVRIDRAYDYDLEGTIEG